MPIGEETQLTITLTKRIGGRDYIAGKQFAEHSRGIPPSTTPALGQIAVELSGLIDEPQESSGWPASKYS
jgi:hypothetical protein